MLPENRMYEYGRAQSQIAGDYATGTREAYLNYQQALDRIAGEAKNNARLALEGYYAELRAASAGDDAAERAAAAWASYQQKYARITQEYLAKCQEQYHSFVETMVNVQNTTTSQALDRYIEMLQDTRREMLERSPKAPLPPASQPPKKSSPPPEK